PTGPFGSVTVTSAAPRVAVADTETLTVSCVSLTNVVELTVTPGLETDTVAPVVKPVPVIVSVRPLDPCVTVAGATEVTVTGVAGTADGAATVPNPLGSCSTASSGWSAICWGALEPCWTVIGAVPPGHAP